MPRYIDADSLMDKIIEQYCKDCAERKGIKNGKWRIIYEIGDAPCRSCGIDDMKSEIEDAPTADVPDRKVGKWLPGKEISRTMLGNECIAVEYEDWHCSECGKRYKEYVLPYKFCPNCGTRMR